MMTMNNLLIRPYAAEDEKGVIKLWFESNLIVPHNNPVCDIERKVMVNPEWFLVGMLDGRIVATCMAGYEGHRGWINYLAVSPQYRRRGVASMMMKAVENRLKAAGCPKINLQIRTSNKEVMKFYKSIGYLIDDVVSMGKRLEHDEPFGVKDNDVAHTDRNH